MVPPVLFRIIVLGILDGYGTVDCCMPSLVRRTSLSSSAPVRFFDSPTSNADTHAVPRLALSMTASPAAHAFIACHLG